MKVLIVGGTGIISGGIVRELLAQGHEPVVLSRGSRKPAAADVETITADKGDRSAFVEALRKRHFDAVIDMISFNAEDVRTTIEAFAERTGHIVICSTIAAYRRPYATVPVHEAAESLFEDPSFGYAYNKAEMERVVQAAWQERRLPLTIIRPSLTFGVGATNIGVLRQNYGIVDRIRRGSPLVIFGDGHQTFSFSFVPDVARAFVGVLGKSATFGEAYHATSEQPTIWKELYLSFGRLIDREPRFAYIPSCYLMEASPDLCSHLYHEKSYDGLFSNDKLRSVVPGFRAEIALQAGLAEILQWWQASGAAVDPAKDALEDQLSEVALQTRNSLKSLFA